MLTCVCIAQYALRRNGKFDVSIAYSAAVHLPVESTAPVHLAIIFKIQTFFLLAFFGEFFRFIMLCFLIWYKTLCFLNHLVSCTASASACFIRIFLFCPRNWTFFWGIHVDGSFIWFRQKWLIFLLSHIPFLFNNYKLKLDNYQALPLFWRLIL